MKIVKWGYLVISLIILGNSALAQPLTSQARLYAAEKDYDKAISIYSEIYSLSPDSFYSEYFNLLISGKKYKQAEQLVEKQMTLKEDPFLNIDLGSEIGRAHV